MGLLNSYESEYSLQGNMIAEACYLLGTEAKLYPPKLVSSKSPVTLSESSDISRYSFKCIDDESSPKDYANDPIPEYTEYGTINVLFEENPKSVLKKMHWYTEGDDLPYVAYISTRNRLDVDDYEEVLVVADSMLDIRYNLKGTSTSKFLITDVVGDGLRPTYWTCKLVPYRGQVDLDDTTPEVDDKIPGGTETTMNYLKVKY